jgi:hypothetical protein
MPETTPIPKESANAAPAEQPQPFEHGEITAKPDRERREDDVEGDRKGELDAGEEDRVEMLDHPSASRGRAAGAKPVNPKDGLELASATKPPWNRYATPRATPCRCCGSSCA